MLVVQVPYLPQNASLRQAVKAMRGLQKSAVVTGHQDDVDLIWIGDVFAALADGISKISGVGPRTPVYPVSIEDVSKWNLDNANPSRTWQQYEAMLDAVGHSYALVGSVGSSAVIVTRHEGLGGKIELVPKDCYCTGPDHHPFPPPNVSSGQACDICGFPIHCEY